MSLVSKALNWVDGIHLNASTRSERGGRPVIVKRRRRGAVLVMRFANGFFRLAKNPVEALVSPATCGQWEVECFTRLHGPAYTAGTDAGGTAWVEVLPGTSLGDELGAGTLQPAMLRAAGVELRRAHGHRCEHYGDGWSHGDAHSGNFLYDPHTDRARLIDFEVRHLRSMSEPDRQADDLFVLLQDVCGRCRVEAWPGLAAALIEGYGDPAVSGRLHTRLTVPGGVPRLWWAVRTTWMRRLELERRLSQLRELLPPERRSACV